MAANCEIWLEIAGMAGNCNDNDDANEDSEDSKWMTLSQFWLCPVILDQPPGQLVYTVLNSCNDIATVKIRWCQILGEVS